MDIRIVFLIVLLSSAFAFCTESRYGGRRISSESEFCTIGGCSRLAKFFRSEKTLGALQYFEPSRVNGKVIVNPPKEAVNEGILKWSSSLVGQFFDKPLPYYVVKRFVESIWASYGKVEVFLLENGLYLFRFRDVNTRDEVWKPSYGTLQINH
ncbi:hypothetical protein SLA2020_350750 [Shorea laevis]